MRNNHQHTAFVSQYGSYALVTGASEGIGLAYAQQLAHIGMSVVLVARRTERLNDLAQQLTGQYGIKCVVIGADLTQADGLQTVLTETASLAIGLVVCNAGFGFAGQFLDCPLPTQLNMLSLNCAALTTLTHHFGQQFRAQGKGGIILLSSVVAQQGAPYSAHYAATKAYVHTLGEALQIEWQGSGVDLLIVAPGPVHTGFATRAQMELGLAASATTVARQSLAALGHKKVSRPGGLAKLLAYALAPLPRMLRIRIMAQAMASKIKPASK